MKLAKFHLPNHECPQLGEVREEDIVAFDGGTELLEKLIAGDLTPAKGKRYALSDVKLMLPYSPRAIFGVGLNYRGHPLQEIQKNTDMRPFAPLIFLKLSTAAVGPFETITCPQIIRELDYEGELAVVMGKAGKIAGYTIANDLTARDLQRTEKQWVRAKSFDAACPIGPWITSADEISDPMRLTLRTWVNQELRQNSCTSELIFSTQEVIDFISQTCTLMPGDLILTGTPDGVGLSQTPPDFLHDGDLIRIEIEGLGVLENRIAHVRLSS